MARVTRPHTGRVVLLCGGAHELVLQALHKGNETLHDTWKLPCTILFPTNIGGLLAWVVCVTRGAGQPHRTTAHVDRVRRLAARRSLIGRHSATEPLKPKSLQA
jgi:hypothetical protein